MINENQSTNNNIRPAEPAWGIPLDHDTLVDRIGAEIEFYDSSTLETIKRGKQVAFSRTHLLVERKPVGRTKPERRTVDPKQARWVA